MATEQSTSIINFNSVSKRYGDKLAVDEVSFEIQRGQIFGLVGPNGAGKTTLLKIITGLVRPTSGTVKIVSNGKGGGADILNVGIVIENPPAIDHLSGLRNLKLLASIKDQVGSGEIVSVLKQVGLNPDDKRPVRKYSLGMKQRLALAQAIMERPEFLILDEPTNGLDPLGIADLRNLLINLRQEGVTILLASHLLTEVERVCDEVAIIKDGRIVRHIGQQGNEGVNRLQAVVRLSTLDDAATASAWANSQGLSVIKEGTVVRIEEPGSMPQLFRALATLNLDIEAVYPEQDTLESIYMKAVAGVSR